ncbi:MAG: tetratricopeptide repeat protein [Thermoanaerobaculaceae bacterium]
MTFPDRFTTPEGSRTHNGSVLRRKGIVGGLATAFLLLAAMPLLAADSFYLGMLRRGTDAFNRRDFPEAVRLLRIACFGFLEEPELLVDGLTRLGLAQLETGDKEAFRATFERVQEAESRFGAYSKAQIAPEQRTAFESAVLRSVPPATLQADPTFTRLVPKPEDVLAKLPPKQRRSELERLLAQEPTAVRWPLMAAELELGEGRPSQAARHAETALRLQPDSVEASRLRGLALAGDQRWAMALAELERLPDAARDPRVQVATLTSFVELDRWEDAVAFGKALPDTITTRPDVARLLRKAQDEVQKKEARAARRAPTPTPTPLPEPPPPAANPEAAPSGEPVAQAALTSPPEPPAATPTPSSRRRSGRPTPTAAPSPNGAALSPEDVAALAQAQELVRTNELLRAFGLARQVADANPSAVDAQRVAGEMAYRIARWSDAVRYFKQAGGVLESEPQRQFYFAVALYETGELAQAAQEMRRCVAVLERTPFVDEYVRKILGSGNAP